MAQAGDLIGIRLLDHLILGHDGAWTSLRQHGDW
ncbi:MAG: JAB domain-containing protein [Thermoanaerobaculia bacterium]